MGRVLKHLNIVILISLIALNFVGVLMPELGFDALWYHLPLSKLLLIKHQWYFPGGLYYYSAMPRLAELLGLPLLSVIGAAGPKLIQFTAGLLICFLLFRLAKKFTGDQLLSLTAVNLFYATWLVSWQSSSGYVDLVRTAFEAAALAVLVIRPADIRSKLLAGFLLGLAIGTKWQALGSLFLTALIFSPLVIASAFLTALPWFYLAYHFTGNPVYPLLTKFMQSTQLAQVPTHFYSPLSVFGRLLAAPIHLTLPIDDFLSPVAGLIYLFCLLGLFSGNRQIRRVALLAVLGTFYFLLTPPPSARYFLPYFPAMVLAAIYIVSRLRRRLALFFIVLFTFSSFTVLILRTGSYLKFLPYLSQKQNLNQFLTSLSSRLPDTFIDSDNYVKQELPANGRYLIKNIHNLYYFPYDFDHDSFADPAKVYDYLITKSTNPGSVTGRLLHTNEIGIQIFKL